MGRGGFRDKDYLGGICEEMLQKGRLLDFPTHGLLISLSSFADVEYRDKRVFNEVCKELAGRIEDLSPKKCL